MKTVKSKVAGLLLAVALLGTTGCGPCSCTFATGVAAATAGAIAHAATEAAFDQE